MRLYFLPATLVRNQIAIASLCRWIAQDELTSDIRLEGLRLGHGAVSYPWSSVHDIPYHHYLPLLTDDWYLQ